MVVVVLKRIGDVALKSIRWFVASGKVHAISKGGEDNKMGSLVEVIRLKYYSNS